MTNFWVQKLAPSHIARIFVRNIRMGAVFGDGIVGVVFLVADTRVAPISESRNYEPFKLEKAKMFRLGLRIMNT